MNILVIQSSSQDPIGVLGTRLESQGAQLFTWLIEQEPSAPSIDYEGLIILGRTTSAQAHQHLPKLNTMVELIQCFHHEDKPIMGICLGAQLIARAFGSKVHKHSIAELGYSPLLLADRTAEEPWLQNLPSNLNLMQWHFDTFDLPDSAQLLMTNYICRNQAYRIGRKIYGFQFHLEVTPEIVMNWLARKNAWIKSNYPYLDGELTQQVKVYSKRSEKFAYQVADAWLSLVAESNIWAA